MSTATNSECVLADKFRGCLVGALLGDCLGAPFEGVFPVHTTELKSFLSKRLDESTKGPPPFLRYTDDTAMTRCLATSLVEKNGFDASDLAQRFTTEYFEQPQRGYGSGVVDVFHALLQEDFEDPFGPARKQFQGLGSYGNGGSMRVAPVAVFYHNNLTEMISVAEQQARLTHTHKNGVNGAILQCLAVHRAMACDAQAPLDKAAYLDFLMEQMDAIESKGLKPSADPAEGKPFTSALRIMQHVLCDEDEHQDLTVEEVADLFGNSISAEKSVPTAIYAFLRSQEPLPYFQTEDPFVRVIVLSIAVGGDTDTIASMAGSISGAFHGLAGIPALLQRHCEDLDVALMLADDMYKCVGAQ